MDTEAVTLGEDVTEAVMQLVVDTETVDEGLAPLLPVPPARLGVLEAVPEPVLAPVADRLSDSEKVAVVEAVRLPCVLPLGVGETEVVKVLLCVGLGVVGAERVAVSVGEPLTTGVIDTVVEAERDFCAEEDAETLAVLLREAKLVAEAEPEKEEDFEDDAEPDADAEPVGVFVEDWHWDSVFVAVPVKDAEAVRVPLGEVEGEMLALAVADQDFVVVAV